MNRELRLTLGFLAFICAVIIYLMFEKYRNFILPPVGLLLFVISVYLILPEVPWLERFKIPSIYLAIAIFGFWMFLLTNYDSYILNSKFADGMTRLTIFLSNKALNMIGIDSRVGNYSIMFSSPPSEIPAIYIDARCSGVHSFLIFVGTFLFMMVDLGRNVNKMRAAVSLTLGVGGAYAGNILRVVILSLIGYHYGYGLLMEVHKYLGFAIFLAFLSVFWYFAASYIAGGKTGKDSNA